MTDIDTSRHILTGVRMSIQLKLENMPVVPVQYGPTDLIAQDALVFFTATEDGRMEWHRMELTGVMPNKAGEPSKRHNSDRYSTSKTSYAPNRNAFENVPDAYLAVISTAGEVLKAMLR